MLAAAEKLTKQTSMELGTFTSPQALTKQAVQGQGEQQYSGRERRDTYNNYQNNQQRGGRNSRGNRNNRDGYNNFNEDDQEYHQRPKNDQCYYGEEYDQHQDYQPKNNNRGKKRNNRQPKNQQRQGSEDSYVTANSELESLQSKNNNR